MKQRTGAIIGIVMALVISTVVGGAVFLAWRWDSMAPLSASVPVVAIFTFVGLLMMTQTDDKHWRITESSLRAAICRNSGHRLSCRNWASCLLHCLSKRDAANHSNDDHKSHHDRGRCHRFLFRGICLCSSSIERR